MAVVQHFTVETTTSVDPCPQSVMSADVLAQKSGSSRSYPSL